MGQIYLIIRIERRDSSQDRSASTAGSAGREPEGFCDVFSGSDERPEPPVFGGLLVLVHISTMTCSRPFVVSQSNHERSHFDTLSANESSK